MSKKWRDLLKGLLIVLVAGTVFVIALVFLVVWLAWRSGIPIPA